MKAIPDPIWWIDEFIAVASQLEGDTNYRSRNSRIDYLGSLWKFIENELRKALDEDWDTFYACERWYSGVYLLETMPCVLYILSKHAQDPEEALVRAVNDTKDNDTIAAIVGAAIGALHGCKSLPSRWMDNLLGRIGVDDDGHIFRIIEKAEEKFWM